MTIPEKSKIRKAKYGDLFRACKEVEDSFFVPFTERTMQQFGSYINDWNTKLAPMHFVARSRNINNDPETKDGAKGFRVWRDK